MAPPFLPQVMPQTNTRLDFSPISNALDGIRDQRNQNAMMDFRRDAMVQEQEMAKQRLAADAQNRNAMLAFRQAEAERAQANADRAFGLQSQRFNFQRQMQQAELERAAEKRAMMERLLGGGGMAQPTPAPAPTLTGDPRAGPIASPQVPQQAAPSGPSGGLLGNMSPTGRQAMLMDYYSTGGKNWGSIIQNDSAKSLTPAQKAVDSKFANEYAEFSVGGGSADIQKNLQQLDFAIAELAKGGVSGTSAGLATESALVGNIVAPRATEVRAAVEEVAQRNLRAVLGGQFAEREGAQLIRRAYDPYADEQVNLRRVRRLRQSIAKAYQQKKRAAEYFEKNGTLSGFTGAIPTLESIERDAGLSQSNNLNKRPSLAEQSSGVFTLPDGRKARRGKDGSWEMID